MLDGTDLDKLLHKIKKFETKAESRSREQRERIKDDKDFLWNDKPLREGFENILGNKRYRRRLDVISNAIRAIVNSYTSYPYKPKVDIPDLSQMYLKLNDDISEAVENALKSAVSFGLGYIVVLPCERNSVIVPIPYSVDRIESVFFDPDSTDMNGADANQVLFVDYKSRSYIKQKYGEEVADKFKNGTILTLTTTEVLQDEMCPVFTYFKKEDGYVTVYKIVADTLVEEPIVLQLKQIPVIPVYGEAIEIDSNRIYRGIVSQCKTIQDMTDMTTSQLMERLAKSPKGMWIAGRRQIGKNADMWDNSDKNIHQLFIYNDKDGTETLPPPTRVESTVEYGDLTTIMNNTVGMMKSVAGVDSIGLPDERNEITATEALLNAKSYNNNIRHFMTHLKYSFKALVELIAEYFNLFDIQINIENGPQENLERQTARQELMALTQMLDDPSDRKRAVVAVASTMNDNAFVAPFLQAITQEDPALTMLKQQATEMQQNYEAQIKQLNDQILLLKTQAIQADTRNKETMAKAELDNATRIYIEELKQKNENLRQDKDFVKDEVERVNDIQSKIEQANGGLNV